MKRLFDFIISFFAVVVLSPIMIIIAILIKLQNNGSVIFKQIRVGKDNKEFIIYKFRTMLASAPNIATSDLKNPETYITSLGKILRKTSLDELPQLFNILKGDMSLVGPRPLINNDSEIELLRRRTELGVSELVPGLTGWAQVNGRDDISTDKKIELEEEYMKKQSFLFDIKILVITFLKVFKQEGIVEGASEVSPIPVQSKIPKNDDEIKNVI